MKNDFPKTLLFIPALIFCVLLFGFFYFHRAINNNTAESTLKEGQWQKETQRRDEIKALDQSVKIIEKERAQLETHFAKSSDIVPFLDTLEGLAEKSSVKAEVTPPLTILEDHTGLLVGMKALGTFSGLYKFLTLLENSPYELEFISMDLQKDALPDITNKNAKASDWSMVFKIKLLSFIE